MAWLPHGIIGIGFAWAGSNQPSFDLYGNWASSWPGFLNLFSSAVILASHFGLAVGGFVITGLDLRHRRKRESPVDRAGAPSPTGG